jgi:DNA-binding MarR family transcriptional regulator
MKTLIEDQLIQKFFDVSKIMHQSATVNSDIFQLSVREMTVLKFIQKNKSVTINQIAQFLKITMPTTTVLLDKLEKNNLIDRTKNLIDKRSVLVKLSSKSTKLINKLIKAKEAKIKFFLSYLSFEDKQSLSKILDKLLLNLNFQNEKK